MSHESSPSGVNRWHFLIATGGGAGLIPLAPGTWGAAVGAILYLLVAICIPAASQWAVVAVLFALVCWGTIQAGPWAESYFGRKDPGSFVSDEIAGLFLTLLGFHLPGHPWLTLAWAFPLTRLFDILKLPPARRLEKLPQGWGVLADDLASSVYAIAILWLLRAWHPEWFT